MSGTVANAPVTLRSLLLRIGVTLGLFAGVNLVAERVLDAARVRGGERENGVVNNGRRAAADVLILGSSRAKHHYDDRLLSRLWGARVFNAGYGGQGIPFSRAALDLIASAHKPRAVILDLAVFGDDMDRAHALDPWYFESPVLRSLPASGADPSIACDAENWRVSTAMRVPLYRFAGQAKHTLQDATKPYSDSGFSPIPVEVHPPFTERRGPADITYSWLEPQLDAIIRQCRAMGTEIIFTVSPRKTDGATLSVFRPAEALAKKRGVPFLEFDEKRYPEFVPDALFIDESHLTSVGAELFTRRLAGVLRPLLPASISGSRETPAGPHSNA